MSEKNSSKTLIYFLGGLIGLATGLASAYLLIKNSEPQSGKLAMTSKEKFNLGIGVVSFLRQVAEMGKFH